MMEKYGTDVDALPATKEQLEEIEKIAKRGIHMTTLKTAWTRKEAEDFISKVGVADGEI